MPNRVVRERILRSRKVNGLKWPAEVFYRRLMSVVDDFGRYDAAPDILRAALYPLKLDKVRNADVSRWLRETEQAGLVVVFVVDGEEYLVIRNFKQRTRAKHSKYPSPEQATVMRPSYDRHVRTETEAKTETKTKTHTTHPPKSPQGGTGGGRKDVHFEDFWEKWPPGCRKTGKTKCKELWKRRKLDGQCERIMEALAAWKQSEQWQRDGGQYIPTPHKWLYQEYYDADLVALRQPVRQRKISDLGKGNHD